MSAILAPSAISRVQKDVLEDFLVEAAGLTEAPIKIYGPQDGKANNPAPPCISWALVESERWEAGQRAGRPGAPSALWTRWVPITFNIFGGINPTTPPETPDPSSFLRDSDRTEALMSRLVNAFHRRLTQHGYRVTGANWGAADRTGIGLGYSLVVEIALPLVREDNPTVHIGDINPEPEISHGNE